MQSLKLRRSIYLVRKVGFQWQNDTLPLLSTRAQRLFSNQQAVTRGNATRVSRHGNALTQAHGRDSPRTFRFGRNGEKSGFARDTTPPVRPTIDLDEFERLADLNLATTAQAAEILAWEKHILKQDGATVAEQRERAGQQQAGRRIFEWVRQLEGLDTKYVLTKQFCIDLSWLLYAEDSDSPLLDWLKHERQAMVAETDIARYRATAAQMYKADTRQGRRARRQHDCFAGLSAARIDLALDGTANDAIRCLKSIMEAHNANGPFSPPISIVGACMPISRHLRSSSTPACDDVLYEWFSNLPVLNHAGGADQNEPNLLQLLDSAQCSLWHPTTPDPKPTLRFWRKTVVLKGDESRAVGISTTKRSSHNTIGFQVFRAWFLLQRQGASEDAEWLHNRLQIDFPAVWRNHRRIMQEIENDPKLTGFLSQQGG